jgi:phosphoglucomutase
MVVLGNMSILLKSTYKVEYLARFYRFIFDAMHAVTGAYAGPIFVEKLGADPVAY